MPDWLPYVMTAIGSGGLAGLVATFFGPLVQDKVQAGRELRTARRDQIDRWRKGIALLTLQTTGRTDVDLHRAMLGQPWGRELQRYYDPNYSLSRLTTVPPDIPFMDGLNIMVDRLAIEWGLE